MGFNGSGYLQNQIRKMNYGVQVPGGGLGSAMAKEIHSSMKCMNLLGLPALTQGMAFSGRGGVGGRVWTPGIQASKLPFGKGNQGELKNCCTNVKGNSETEIPGSRFRLFLRHKGDISFLPGNVGTWEWTWEGTWERVRERVR